MKITIIGTSNSVMRGGYVQALAHEHSVHNLSSGRNPIFYHINTLIKNLDIINQSDVLLVDHYLNEINFYNNKNIKDYKTHIRNFYVMLRSLETYPIVLFLPEMVEDSKKSEYVFFLKSTLDELGMQYIDFNQFEFQDHHFSNIIHAERNISFVIGKLLARELSANATCLQKFKQGTLYETPYIRIDTKQLSSDKLNKIKKFANCLIDIDYITLDHQAEITFTSEMQLLSYGYFNVDKYSAFNISDDSNLIIHILCSGTKYYHEALAPAQNTTRATKVFRLSPPGKDNNYTNIRNDKLSGEIEHANIVELLFYSPEIETVSSNYSHSEHLTFNFSELNEYLTFVFYQHHNALNYFNKNTYQDANEYYDTLIMFFKKEKYLKAASILKQNRQFFVKLIDIKKLNLIGYLKHFASRLETNNNIEDACELMKICLLMRPRDQGINEQMNHYAKILNG